MKTLNRIRDFASLYRMYRRHYTPLRASRRYSQPMAPYRCEECGQWHIGHPSSLGKPIPIIQANHHITTKERE